MKATQPLTYIEHDTWGKSTEHRILVIEYLHGQPYAVHTNHSSFDFNYSKKYALLGFEYVGGGIGSDDPEHMVHGFCKPGPPPAQMWASPEVRLYQEKSRQRIEVDDKTLIELGYVRLQEPLLIGDTRNPFEVAEEGRMEYCSVCDDHLPDDHHCGHLFKPSGGELIGTGAEKPDDKSFFAALDWLATVKEWRAWRIWDRWSDRDLLEASRSALHAVERNLLRPEPRRLNACSRGIEDEFTKSGGDDWEKQFYLCEDGLGWLTTLGPDTPKENAMTLRWIMEWRLSRAERAEQVERERIIKALGCCVAGMTDIDRAARSREIFDALGVRGKRKDELVSVPLELMRQVLRRFQIPSNE